MLTLQGVWRTQFKTHWSRIRTLSYYYLLFRLLSTYSCVSGSSGVLLLILNSNPEIKVCPINFPWGRVLLVTYTANERARLRLKLKSACLRGLTPLLQDVIVFSCVSSAPKPSTCLMIASLVSVYWMNLRSTLTRNRQGKGSWIKKKGEDIQVRRKLHWMASIYLHLVQSKLSYSLHVFCILYFIILFKECSKLAHREKGLRRGVTPN